MISLFKNIFFGGLNVHAWFSWQIARKKRKKKEKKEKEAID